MHISIKHPKQLKLLAFVLIALFVISVIFLAKYAAHVKLTANYAELFSSENEANEYRQFHREIFGADDTLLIAIIEPQQLSADFLLKLSLVTEQLAKIPEFIRVSSITNSSVIKSTEDTINIEPVFDFQSLQEKTLSDQEINALVAQMRKSALLRNRYISATHQSFIILAELPATFDNSHKVTPIAEQFRQSILDGFGLEKTKVQFAGVAFTRMGLMDLMKQDLVFLVPLCLMLIGIFLWFLYRQWLPIVMTYIVMGYSIIATLGFMGIAGIDLNQLTMIFPLIIMVVMIANVLHFLQFYYKALDGHHTHYKALTDTIKSISLASLLSCITTSIGFFSLMISDMPILREFGLVLGISLLISAAALIFLQPSLLLLLHRKVAQKNYSNYFSMFTFNSKQLYYYLGISVLLFAVSLFLIPNNQFNFYLEDMLEAHHPQILASHTLNHQYSGSLPLEISLLGDEGDFKKAEILARIQMLQTWLEKKGIYDSISLATVIKALHHAFDEKAFPKSDALIAQYLLLAEASIDDVVLQLTDANYSMTRIRAFMPDMGSTDFKALQEDFNNYADSLFINTNVKARLTGEMPLVYDGFDRLTHELLLSLLLAVIAILFVLAIIFKKFSLLLASIFPNVLPIFLGLAFYSLFDHGLNPLPAIAFCIGIGIAVDDTIHLFSRYQYFVKQGLSDDIAIKKAIESSAPALILSSIILCLGFLLFLLSGFTWNQELGLLVSFIIVCALLADLYVTPACVYLLASGHRPSC